MEKVKKHSQIILLIICGLVLAAIYLLSDPLTAEEGHSLSTTEEVLVSAEGNGEEQPDQSQETEVYVDIKGQVKNPGVYQLSADKRVRDAIELAGGFLEEAESKAVNLAQRVQDEQVIMVPAKGEQQTDSMSVAGNNANQISINNANASELTQLPGIGPSKAEAIVQHREENGSYRQIEDLLDVTGIGEKTLEKIAPSIQVP
ncbi:helix-hairpin-helix domain-containing protein [Virgibacillus senegalensis]|uniref:helix-hairpin-helix domain-containing protein n=1 Tax=Virgibacillus senegalensis TaxID=1499679 RepID=UPI00069E90C2|nr:helix-hairpin-helix domain-containing protein [Virgibacillus senegalensis]